MVHKQKRLLVSVDCSERALQTAKYAGEEDAFKGMKTVVRAGKKDSVWIIT